MMPRCTLATFAALTLVACGGPMSGGDAGGTDAPRPPDAVATDRTPPPTDAPAPMDTAVPMDAPAPPTDTPAPPADAPVTCPTGQALCGSLCVDTATDPANCGRCANACAAGSTCQAGACVVTCGAGQMLCGGRCVTVGSDPAHCGACGRACAAGQVCAGGTCTTTCAAPRMLCTAAGMMVCADLQTDAANCGRCGAACAAGQSCVAGACRLVCPAGQTNCGGRCVATATDPANCGVCGRTCAAPTTCVAGACTLVCPAGQTNCGGRCVSTASDPANCGACGRACAAGQTCSGGTCMGTTCAAPLTACSGVCADLATDPNHCGACARRCAAGEVCRGGACMTPTSSCPPPPAGVSAQAAAAYTLENNVRAAMGVPCAVMVPAINTAAERHCAYYAANRSIAMCVANAHVEVTPGCAMYVAAQFFQRMTAAGYTGSPSFEDMAFSNNGMAAVQQWIDSVWHRTPVLSPWVRDIGYGGATGCDTMDFGVGAATPATTVATYPYAGQTGVPTSFDGRFEGPMPPAPPTGWPSGYPIHLYMRGGSVTSHEIFVDGTTTPLAHVWLAPGSAAAMGLLRDEYVMYTHARLTAATRYRVRIVGSNGAGPVTRDWTFTTR